eukprot:9091943-Pyramimonas_sp.AAC.1
MCCTPRIYCNSTNLLHHQFFHHRLSTGPPLGSARTSADGRTWDRRASSKNTRPSAWQAEEHPRVHI